MNLKLPQLPGINTNAGIEGAIAEAVMPGSGLIVAAAGNLDPNLSTSLSNSVLNPSIGLSDLTSSLSGLGGSSSGSSGQQPQVPVLSGVNATSTRTYIIFGIIFMIIVIVIAVLVGKHKTTT